MRRDVTILAVILGLSMTTTTFANCQNLVGNWTTICWPSEGTSNAIVAIKEDGTATYSFTDTDGSEREHSPENVRLMVGYLLVLGMNSEKEIILGLLSSFLIRNITPFREFILRPQTQVNQTIG